MSQGLEVLPPTRKPVSVTRSQWMTIIGIVVIMGATFSGLFLPGELLVTLIVFVSILVIPPLWIVRRGLLPKAWLSLIFAGVFGFVFVAVCSLTYWRAFTGYGWVFMDGGNGWQEFFHYDLGNALLGCFYRLVGVLGCSALCIWLAERFHRSAALPPHVMLQQPASYDQAMLKQVGFTETGEPLFISVGQLGMPGSPMYPARTNVLSILTLVFGLLGGIVAIPMGHVALSQIRRTGESGRGMAIAGLVLAYFWLAAVILYIVMIVVALS